MLFAALGSLCVMHCAGTLLSLVQQPAPRQPAPRQPAAWDARTGRPLTVRLDRRRHARPQGRRAGDARRR